MANARRVAAATQILQQQGVIKLPDLRIAEADFLPDVDPDPAAAHAMTGRLTLDHIERMAERAEQFGEPDFLLARELGVRGGHGRFPSSLWAALIPRPMPRKSGSV